MKNAEQEDRRKRLYEEHWAERIRKQGPGSLGDSLSEQKSKASRSVLQASGVELADARHPALQTGGGRTSPAEPPGHFWPFFLSCVECSIPFFFSPVSSSAFLAVA